MSFFNEFTMLLLKVVYIYIFPATRYVVVKSCIIFSDINYCWEKLFFPNDYDIVGKNNNLLQQF